MAPSQSKLCPFLDLPAELRNRIYDYALAGPTHGRQDIPVSEGRCSEPGILRACRQTRQEATPIFYHRWEVFYLIVTDGKFEPQLQHWVWTKVDSDKLRVDYHGQLEWDDLMVWFSLCHQGIIEVKKFCDGTYENETVEKAFKMAAAMKTASWAVTEQVLTLFKEGAEDASQAGFDLSTHWN
jgi:hypothetical protein